MAALKLSTTELLHAITDDEYFDRIAKGQQPAPPRPVTPAGAVPVQGIRFHSLARKFVDWLVQQPDQSLSSADVLWSAMYVRFAQTGLTEISEKNAESALHLADCLRSFCAHIDELRRQHPSSSSWNDLFHTQEMAISATEIDNTGVSVSGQIDLIRSDSGSELAVVDYKLSRGDNAEKDMLQLAIYHKLLAIAQPDRSFCGILEYYEPELEIVPVSADLLSALYTTKVEPVIQSLAAANDSSSAPVSRETKTSGANQSCVDGSKKTTSTAVDNKKCAPDQRGQTLVDALAEFKLGVEVLEVIDAPQLVRYQLRPEPGIKVASLANRASDLQIRLGLPQPPNITPCAGCITVDVLREQPKPVFWQDLADGGRLDNLPGEVAFPIGVGVNGELICGDFADSNTAHALVAGVSGSGKSEFLKSMVATLLRRYTPQDIKISLVDPKVVTFSELDSNAHGNTSIVHDLESAIELMEIAVEEMEYRYHMLAKNNVTNLGEYRECHQSGIPYWIIVFDEFADLVLAGKKEKELFETQIKRITAKGRAAGIHLVLATQRPDKNVVSGLIKANLPLKVCLKVTNAVNSNIVLDQKGAETLMGRGDLLCDLGRGVQRAQSPFLRRGEFSSVAKV